MGLIPHLISYSNNSVNNHLPFSYIAVYVTEYGSFCGTSAGHSTVAVTVKVH